MLSSPSRISRSIMRIAAALLIVSLLGGCSLFLKDADEITVEKLRLEYKEGKMRALLDIIIIYEDEEMPKSVRLAAANAMSESRHPKAVESLSRMVANAEALDIEMILLSIDALAQIPSNASAKAFNDALISTDLKLSQLRTKLIEGLEKVGSEDYIHTMIGLYQASRERHFRTEQMITTALGNIGDDKAIPVLIQIASDINVSIGTRSTAMEILAKKDSPEIVRMFANMLGEPETNLRMRDFALDAMGDIKEERLILALLETYNMGKQEYFTLMNTLLDALGDFDDPAIKPALIAIATSDEYPTTFRKKAIGTLANFKDPMVLTRIIPLLEDPKNYNLMDDIIALTDALEPGSTGREKIRRASYKAALNWRNQK